MLAILPKKEAEEAEIEREVERRINGIEEVPPCALALRSESPHG
jgi:hypothetical protein